MKIISALSKIHTKGLYGDFEGKKDDSIIKISEIKDISIFQVVQFNKSDLTNQNLKIDGIEFPKNVLQVNSNNMTRILWQGPKNWLVISNKKQKELFDEFKNFDSKIYAVTDLSHTRAAIEMEGKHVSEVLKKGCPLNINDLKINNSVNSVFNGITITIDVLQAQVEKVRVYSLRSFGESLHYSLTDASLEFGYKNI